MPVLSLACHLRHNTPNIPSRYNNGQTTKQTKAINNSYIYINISCKCDTNRAGHFTLDAYASRPVACCHMSCYFESQETIIIFCVPTSLDGHGPHQVISLKGRWSQTPSKSYLYVIHVPMLFGLVNEITWSCPQEWLTYSTYISRVLFSLRVMASQAISIKGRWSQLPSKGYPHVFIVI